MGGQNSKLTPEAEVVPPQICSLWQTRFEEIKGRTKAQKLKPSDTLSKKQLLKDGDQEEDDDSMPHSLRFSPEFDNLSSAKTSPTMENKSKVAPILPDKGTKQTDDEDQNKDQIKGDVMEFSIEDHKETKGVNVYVGGVFLMEQTTKGEEEDEDNEEGMRRNSKIYMCQASLSFRVYCMEPLEIDNDNSKNDSTDEDTKHKKSPSAESADSSVDSVDVMTDHNDAQGTKTKKKGRRRRIKSAFSMGGPNPVKNLLNIKGCYYAGCTGGHDTATYVAEKSAAT